MLESSIYFNHQIINSDQPCRGAARVAKVEVCDAYKSNAIRQGFSSAVVERNLIDLFMSNATRH